MVSSRLVVLDLYRGLAAFIVMMYHFQESFSTNLLNNILIINGHVFTDYFFVLSGFVIHYSYSSRNRPISFLLKRLNRVYPLLASISFIYFCYRILGNIIVNKSSIIVIQEIIVQFLYSLFLLNSTPIFDNMSGTIGPSWSISGEIIAYVIYAVCMVVDNRRTSTTLIIFLSFMMLYNLDGFYFTNDWGFLRTLFGFNIGVFVANNFESKKTLISFILLIFAAYFFLEGDLLEGLTLNILFALLIRYTASVNVTGKMYLIFDYIGRYSFGFYLWHRLVINAVLRLNDYMKMQDTVGMIILNLSVITIISILLAHLSYILIEKRFRIFKTI